MLAYDSIQKLVEAAEKQNKSISEVCLEDQAESMGLTKEEVFKKMEEAFDVMVDSVKTGMDENLRSTSGLTGGEGFKMFRYANQKDGGISGTFMSRAMARAMAVSQCSYGKSSCLANSRKLWNCTGVSCKYVRRGQSKQRRSCNVNVCCRCIWHGSGKQGIGSRC